MIKTLYREQCLRYFIVPEMVLLAIFICFVPFGFTILLIYLLNNLFGNIFQNIPLIYLLLKIILMYLGSMKLKKINKIEDEEKKKKYKIRLKIIIFLVNIVILVIFAILSTNLINQIVNTILSF